MLVGGPTSSYDLWGFFGVEALFKRMSASGA